MIVEVNLGDLKDNFWICLIGEISWYVIVNHWGLLKSWECTTLEYFWAFSVLAKEFGVWIWVDVRWIKVIKVICEAAAVGSHWIIQKLVHIEKDTDRNVHNQYRAVRYEILKWLNDQRNDPLLLTVRDFAFDIWFWFNWMKHCRYLLCIYFIPYQIIWIYERWFGPSR